MKEEYGRARRIPNSSTLALEGSHLKLDTVDAVDTVQEEDQNEDECYLLLLSNHCQSHPGFSCCTFIPYCNFATIGLSDMKLKNLRLILYGNGAMMMQKRNISTTRRTKTWRESVSRRHRQRVLCGDRQEGEAVILTEWWEQICGCVCECIRGYVGLTRE